MSPLDPSVEPRVCGKFVGNEARRGEVFIVQAQKIWIELRRSVMTPCWGVERWKRRHLYYKMPPLRGAFASSGTGRDSGSNPQICRTVSPQDHLDKFLTRRLVL